MGLQSPALVVNQQFKNAVKELARTGAAFVPAALPGDFREHMLLEVRGGTFERLPAEMGPVRQEADLLLIREPFDRWPVVARLRLELVEALRLHGRGRQGLARWWPNEAYVQRYEAGALGVTPHRDSKRFVILIAVFTLAGSATFSLCRDRAGEVIEEWAAGPGSLIMLRAPSFGDEEDSRPFHRVLGPATGQRYSLTFRMNVARE